MMPVIQQFPHKGRVLVGLSKLSLAITAATLTAILSSGCGKDARAGNAAEAEVVAKALNASSFAQFNSVKLTLSDASITPTEVSENRTKVTVATGKVGRDESELKIDSALSGKLLVATIEASSPSSTYYDPILQKDVLLGSTKLHALFRLGADPYVIRIDPYTEIAYQRALVLAGDVKQSERDARTTWSDVSSDMVAQAQQEVSSRLLGSTSSKWFEPSSTDYMWANISSIPWATFTPDNDTQANYAEFVFASANLQAYYSTVNPSSTKPLLDFTTAATLDMLDGDLDGRSVMQSGATVITAASQKLVSANADTENVSLTYTDEQKKARDAYRDSYLSKVEQAVISLFGSYISPNTSRCNGVVTPSASVDGRTWTLSGNAGNNGKYCEVEVRYQIPTTGATNTTLSPKTIIKTDGNGKFEVKLSNVSTTYYSDTVPSGRPWKASDFVYVVKPAPTIKSEVAEFVTINKLTAESKVTTPLVFSYAKTTDDNAQIGRNYLPIVGAGNYTDPFGLSEYISLKNQTTNTFTNAGKAIKVTGSLTPLEASQIDAIEIQWSYSETIGSTTTKEYTVTAALTGDPKMAYDNASGVFTYQSDVVTGANPNSGVVLVRGKRNTYLQSFLDIKLADVSEYRAAVAVTEPLRYTLDYFIGTHTLAGCEVLVRPTGDIQVSKNGTTIIRNIGRDNIDSLFKRDNGNYRLNIGTTTTDPAGYTIIDIANNAISKVTVGSLKDAANTAPDSTALTTVDFSCGT